ncbi:MAG: hypothetical protein A2Y12_19950 [Planctomycetes bacterium GWF2_42_9]|nr:MAG: hypothetical protein A2Y12_19950 [Planctomycetes bacterium GWF2_42_9]
MEDIKLLFICPGYLIAEKILRKMGLKYQLTFVDEPWPSFDSKVELHVIKGNNFQQILTSLMETEFDAVVYLASMFSTISKKSIPKIDFEQLYQTLEFVSNKGIAKLIYASSVCVSGFVSHKVDYKPLYIPIDEEHPCLPHEPHGLVKWIGELLCEQYSRAYGIECICLRFGQLDFTHSISSTDNEDNWFKSIVRIENVLQALELSLKYNKYDMEIPFKSFYISDAETSMLQNSLDFIKTTYPEMPPPVKDLNYFANAPKGSLFSNQLAIRELGYNPD